MSGLQRYQSPIILPRENIASSLRKKHIKSISNLNRSGNYQPSPVLANRSINNQNRSHSFGGIAKCPVPSRVLYKQFAS